MIKKRRGAFITAASFWLLCQSLFIFSCAGRTPAIKSSNGIASLEKVTLGGLEQWILIRGQDRSNPVLLYLHGGPGSAEMGTAHIYGEELEQHFVVVHWDQRGAGKSYHANIPTESMNINQFVLDTHRLVEILIKRFSVKKLYLVGHSWGSLLGVLTVSQHPELYYAFIGMGQVVDMEQSEALSYQFVLEQARQLKDQEAVMTLEKIGPPPYKQLSDTVTQRQYVWKFGGAMYDLKKREEMYKYERRAPEYTPFDLRNLPAGELFSAEQMWDEVLKVNLFKQMPRIEVPVYFFEGRHDYNVPGSLVEQYYQSLDAPQGKTLIWFEQSAHWPEIEEPDKFNQAMVRVLEETYHK